MAYNILIFGASYGSLLATKLLLAGHNVKLVCVPAEVELINKEGTRVRMPVKGREGLVEVDSRKLPGKLSAAVPTLGPHDFPGDYYRFSAPAIGCRNSTSRCWGRASRAAGWRPASACWPITTRTAPGWRAR